MTAEPSAELLDRALIEEAAKKSGLLWVRRDGGRDRALWHAWVDGAVVVVGDGGEQPLDGLDEGQDVVVTLRSRDKWGRLVAFRARTELLTPRSEAWLAAVDELKGKRLNALDHDAVSERWAEGSHVLRLVPQGLSVERPGEMPDAAHKAVPVATEATTRRPIPGPLPKLVLGRKRRRQP